MKEIEAIRTALAAGPTPGPWIGAGPSHGKPLPEYLNSVVYDGEDGDENDWGDICNDTTHEDAKFIAACNPAAMQAIIAHIDAQAEEIERLHSALAAVEPYLDAIVCFASTQGEHEPNRIAAQVRDAMKEQP